MKRFIYIMFAAAFAACDKLPDDSLLDGLWQVESEQGAKAYWGFRLKLLQLSNASTNYFAHFEHRGDSLLVYDLCHHSTNATAADNNEWITRSEASVLLPWGLHPVDADAGGTKLRDAFRIRRIDGDRLLLQNDSTTIRLRKY